MARSAWFCYYHLPLPNLIEGQGAQKITTLCTVQFEDMPEIRIIEIVRRQIPARQTKKWNTAVSVPAALFLDFVSVRVPDPATGQDSKLVTAKLVRKAKGTRWRCGKVQRLLMIPDERLGIVDRLKYGIP
jgi:hypothetical protein